MTPTAIAFDTARFDSVPPLWSAGQPTRLTASAPGRYQISGGVFWTVLGAGLRETQIRLNGTTILAVVSDTQGADAVFQNLTTLFMLGIGDYVELVVQHSDTGAVAVANFPDVSPEFMMVQV